MLRREAGEQALLIMQRRAELPTQPQVQAQTRRDFPVVLEVGSVLLAAQERPRPPEGGGVVHVSQIQIGHAKTRLRSGDGVLRRGRGIVKRSPARAHAVGSRAGDDRLWHILEPVLEAELKLVPADHFGRVVLNVYEVADR